MVTVDTLEGLIDGTLWYHYDVADDVLYLRLARHRETPCVGEENDDGFIVLRTRETDEAVGLTIVNWWKRFGKGQLPDSIREFQLCIEPWANRVAA